MGELRGSVRSGDQDDRPNVLIIMTDDQRAHGWANVMPATRRWFRRGGTDFANAFATTPVCCPSRASIFTGRYAHNHGVLRTRQPLELDQRSTMQRYLQGAGYRTAIFGKFLNRWPLGMEPPYFDEWAIFANSSESGYYGGLWNVDGDVREVKRYGTDFIASRAVDFLRSTEDDGEDRPWLIFLHPAAPHPPNKPRLTFARARVPRWHGNPATHEQDRSDKPRFVRGFNGTMERARRVRAAQLRTLMSVDRMVARVFGALAESGQARNTLAFFMSDNGMLWSEHGRIGKTLPYAPSVRIPLLMRWPDRVEAGALDRRLAANIDIVPTVLDAVGVNPDPRFPVDGRNLLAGGTRDDLLLENWQSHFAWASLQGESWQYIEYYRPSGRVAFREYYDLVTDPWQLTNLLADEDPTNDPPWRPRARRLGLVRECVAARCP